MSIYHHPVKQSVTPRHLTWFWLMALILHACASKPIEPVLTAIPEPGNKTRHLEISYIRGGNLHQFVLSDNGEMATAVSYLDRQKIKEITIKKTKYLEIAKSAEETIAGLQRGPAESSTSHCRMPFIVKIVNSNGTKTVEGCRSREDVAVLGKLIREVEFIMSSEMSAARTEGASSNS